SDRASRAATRASARSLTVLQALGQRVRQPCGADRARGPRDVVVGAHERRRALVEIEQQPRCARVAVARLADAARVQQPFAVGDLKARALAAWLTARRLALVA